MSFVSFYPGPSQLDPGIPAFMADACDSGILSQNHRSPAFVALSKRTVEVFREKMELPKQYQLFFLSSATESWEVLAQSFPELLSLHLYSGAFGQKWLEYRQAISANAIGFPFDPQKSISLNKLRKSIRPEVICITHNETSNGTKVPQSIIGDIRRSFSDALMFVDATSSMGGVCLDWLSADVWFASVQKCFGLPAGMAVMACSPRALAKAQALGHRQHYNSLIAMAEKMKDFQTTHTPNVLGVYLLNRVLESRAPIREIDRRTKANKLRLSQALVAAGYHLLINNARVRSDTVVAIQDLPERVALIKQAAKEAGYLLGNGYGDWKLNTFRIANFPAVSDQQMQELTTFLRNWQKASKAHTIPSL